MTQTVGKVYAEALFALSQEEQNEKKVYEELNAAADMFAENPEFTALLSVPNLGTEEKLGILRKVIGDGSGTAENFLCLLVEKHRINRIGEIRRAFNDLYYEAFSIAEVFVTSAQALTQAQRDGLTEKLAAKLGKQIRLIESVDASLLGGLVVQYGDTRMDNSLRTRMKEMSDTLVKK
ncbi:MAG: ATP synthase F1 subunit delta [Oscillospiraceae bacterium]|nr:ATP synthase F1 subunit delta [Oscillospiraceae bacterium]